MKSKKISIQKSIQKHISLSALFIQMLLARTTRLEFTSCYQAIPIVRHVGFH